MLLDSQTIRICVAIVAITVIELVALCKGKNGIILRLTIAVIAAAAGVSIAQLFHIH
ncbi:MAG: hypothetical protein ABSC21_23730 [Terriglobia bacterium]|jgi:hypothetical protein